MTLPRSTIESIDDIAHYLKLIAKELKRHNDREDQHVESKNKLIAKELKQMNEREEAKIRGEEERYIYADNDESFP